jgi:uncharacterized protein DUF397
MTAWTKSSHSEGAEHSNCVEVLLQPQAIAVRDSKAPEAGHLTLPNPAWAALITSLNAPE